MGKTRAAVEYAWAHRAEYTALALLDAETGDKLQAGLAALVWPLRLPEQAVPDEAARMEAALAWLNANPGWLLILDNIDTEAALAAANRLLGRLQGGRAVLTSRLAAGFARGVERLDLDVLTLDDAAAFLLEATDTSRRKAADDAAQARTLARRTWASLRWRWRWRRRQSRPAGSASPRTSALWQGNRGAGGRLGQPGDHRLPPRGGGDLADLGGSADARPGGICWSGWRSSRPTRCRDFCWTWRCPARRRRTRQRRSTIWRPIRW